jgi:ABC-2 type transport system permease protein
MLSQFIQGVWQAIIRIFAFISKEMRAILHQPRLVFSLILGPFFILLLFGVGYRNAPQTLRTLFVVPQDSWIEGFVEEYSQSLGERIAFAGITHDAEEADGRLRKNEVDLVIVTPFDPMSDWQGDNQSTFMLYHDEIDPLEESYIRVMGQQYTEELNRQVLLTAVTQSQQEADTWHKDVNKAKVLAGTVREAMAAGDQVRARSSAESLQQELDLLTLALGSGMAMVGGLEQTTGSDTTQTILAKMESLQSNGNKMVEATANESSLQQGQDTIAQVEASLDEMDTLLQIYRETDSYILVAPFRSETLAISKANIEPMHFYVPAVIALLLQHIAITLAGLSIIREKQGGAMELFKAAPVSALEMLLGKSSSYLLLTGALAAVLTGLIVLGLRVPQLGLWSNYALVILALLLASLGVGFHISLSARSDSQAIQYGMLTLLAAIFFSGFFLPLYRLAPFTRVISWLLPATYGTTLLQDVMLRGQSPPLLLLAALFTFAVILFLSAWLRLRRQMIGE